MTICPTCHSETEVDPQNYGTLFTCPKCSAVFFIDWAGLPEVASDELVVETSDEIVAVQASAEEEFPNLDTQYGQNALPAMTEARSDSSDLSDIADFGNADLGQVAFSYTMIISGIDSGGIRLEVQEALLDSKFGWNVTQLMAQIKDGVLTIQSMSAVKASILMQRVKYLPVKISWRQDVLSSST